jgi:hypothetical protein
LCDLQFYDGLLKGGAELNHGFITRSRNRVVCLDLDAKREKEIQQMLSIAKAQNSIVFQVQTLVCECLSVTIDEILLWNIENGIQLELNINNAKASGRIVGVALQGSITSAIHFGIAIAVANPALFAAGIYYAISAIIRIGGIVVQNNTTKF